VIYAFFYRTLMRIAHRFDWHYAPFIGPFEDGRVQRWCKWCGFRQSYASCPACGSIDIGKRNMLHHPTEDARCFDHWHDGALNKTQ